MDIHTNAYVKLLLSPRQSRGITYFIYDSLPDGWDYRLMHRRMRARGLNPDATLQQGLTRALSSGHANAKNRLQQTVRDWQRIHNSERKDT